MVISAKNARREVGTVPGVSGGRPQAVAERAAVIEQYQPLVKYVIGRLSLGLPSVLDYEDIVGYGMVGLIEALDRYDDTKGVRFETYAVGRIRGAILDALRAMDRLPRSVRQKAKRLDEVRNNLTASLGREPTREELARALGISIDQFHVMLTDVSWATVSLDGMLDRGESGEGGGTAAVLPDPSVEDFGARLEGRQTHEALAGALKVLPQREFHIVSLYYKEQLTMKEIAAVMNISESRVCQLHGRALALLRQTMVRDQAA